MTPTANPQQLGPQGPDTIRIKGMDVSVDAINKLSPEEKAKVYKMWQDEQPAGKGWLQQGLDTPILGRLMSGAAAGGPQALMGDLPGAAIGAGIGALLPAKTPTDLATYGAGGFMGPAFKAAQGLGTPLMRMLASAGVGLGQEGVNAGIRAIGGEKPTSVGSMLTSAAIPAVVSKLGSAAEPALTRQATGVNLQNTVDSLTGQSTPIGPGMTQLSGHTPVVQDVLDDAKKQFVTYQNNQKAMQAVGQQLQDTRAQQAKLLTQFMGPDGPAENAELTKKYQQLSKYVPDEFMQEKQQLGKLQAAIDDTQNSIKNKFISADTGEAQLKSLQAQQSQLNQQIVAKKVEQLKNASMAQIGDQYTAATKSVKALQDTFDGIQKEVADNPFENAYLKTLVSPDSKGPTTVKTFVQNLVQGDAEHVQGLYDYLGQQKDGEAKIKGIQAAMINEFLNQAYDQKSGTLSNAAQLTSASGPFNMNKLQAIFGDGVEGRQNSQAFQTIVSDVRSLTEKQPQQGSLYKDIVRPQFIVLPTAIALHNVTGMPTISSLAAGEGAALMVTSLPKLVQSAMSNPTLAKAIHNYASSGAQGQLSPVVTKYFAQNGSKY